MGGFAGRTLRLQDRKKKEGEERCGKIVDLNCVLVPGGFVESESKSRDSGIEHDIVDPAHGQHSHL